MELRGVIEGKEDIRASEVARSKIIWEPSKRNEVVHLLEIDEVSSIYVICNFNL